MLAIMSCTSSTLMVGFAPGIAPACSGFTPSLVVGIMVLTIDVASSAITACRGMMVKSLDRVYLALSMQWMHVEQCSELW